MSGFPVDRMARYFVILLACLLSALALFSASLGFYRLTIAKNYPNACDINLRWRDSQYFLHQLDPTNPERLLEGVPKPEIGYPPWSMTVMPVIAPFASFQTTRFYFAFLDVIALVILGRYLFRLTAKHGVGWGIISALSFYAFCSNLHCLAIGQLGIILTAMIAIAFEALDKDRQLLGGFLLGLTLIKPQLAGLFLLIPFVRGQWIAVVTASAVLALTTAFSGFWLQTNPVDMLKRAFTSGVAFADEAQNPFVLAFQSANGSAPGTLTVMAVGATVCLILVYLLKNRLDTLSLMGVVAVVTMFWCYRKQYDVMPLAFLVAACLRNALESRTILAWTAFALCAVPLWIPMRLTDVFHSGVQLAFATFWICSGVMIILHRRPIAPAVGENTGDPLTSGTVDLRSLDNARP